MDDEGCILTIIGGIALCFGIYIFYLKFGQAGFIVVGVSVAFLMVGWTSFKDYLQRQKSSRAKSIADAQAESERAARHSATQSDLGIELEGSRSRAAELFLSLPAHLVAAETHLERAETNFEQRAFSPFWEQIEATLRALAQVDSGCTGITYIGSDYIRTAKQYDGKSGTFPVASGDTRKIRMVSEITNQRLKSVVFRAQRDFQFATIFEQRRTNSILISGFNNLGSAIEGLGARIERSLDTLNSSLCDIEMGLERQHYETSERLREIHDSFNSAAQAAENQRRKIARSQSEAADRHLAMLDNIQRRRKPLPGERGSRIF